MLAAWLEWGPDALERIDGMFAFALCELDSRRVFLARDRLYSTDFFFERLEKVARQNLKRTLDRLSA